MGKIVEKLLEWLGITITESRNDHNWPAVTAIEKLDRHMPTRYPFRREKVSWQSWPPFTGMRVELGGD